MIKLSSERVLANNKEVPSQRDENLATNMMYSDKIADFSQILTRFLIVYLIAVRDGIPSNFGVGFGFLQKTRISPWIVESWNFNGLLILAIF